MREKSEAPLLNLDSKIAEMLSRALYSTLVFNKMKKKEIKLSRKPKTPIDYRKEISELNEVLAASQESNAQLIILGREEREEYKKQKLILENRIKYLIADLRISYSHNARIQFRLNTSYEEIQALRKVIVQLGKDIVEEEPPIDAQYEDTQMMQAGEAKRSIAE